MSLRVLALVCFFLSGATGLLYQVVWTRLFGTTIGNTHFSITVVVSVFMGGLALGSYLGGKIADRSRNPLRIYGILNLLGALLCLAVVPAVGWGQPLFGWLYSFYDGHPEATPLLLSRIAFSALLILAPTTCMGATLPVLSRYFTTKMSDVGSTVGRLYTVNTFGAVVGVFLAGFWAMEHVGVWWTTAVAVTIDVVIGILVIIVSRGKSVEMAAPVLDENNSSRERNRLPLDVRLAVFAFGATGFGNMLLQIAWTKAIVQTIGNSTYAFSLIVTLFILGIGIGGGIMTLVVDRLRNLNLALGIVVTATAALISLTIPMLGRFPIWGARFFDAVDVPDHDTFLRIKLGMVALVILPSTTLMGMVFPIVGKIRTQAIERVGSAVGSAYFANTLGAILGTLAGGFLFIPWFGFIYYTLYLGAAISLVVGLLLIGTSMRKASSTRLGWIFGIALLIVLPNFLLRPHGVLGSTSSLWDPAILSKGAYIYYGGSYYSNRKTREVLPTEQLIDAIRRGNHIEYYKEGIHAPVAVVSNDVKGLALRISGKTDASLPREGHSNKDMPHQIMAGHLPMILHPNPKHVLTLGLGGGVTLGTLTLYPIDRVDSLEISKEVIEAARLFFEGPNRGSLSDTPRRPVRNIIGDGRNHLLYTKERYDVITSVPSNPWIAGIGTLFTEEFFTICSERLKPGGIVCNWIHKINMRDQDIRTVFRTFTRVFGENAQLWDLGYDSLLIGSNDPIRFDGKRLKSMLEVPEIREDLSSLGIIDSRSFLRHFRWNIQDLLRYSGDGPTNTDASPILEFSCPRGLYGHRLHAYASISASGISPIDGSWLQDVSEADLDHIRRARMAFADYLKVHVLVDRFERVIAAQKNAGSDAAFGVDPISGEKMAVNPSAAERRKLESEHLKIIRLFARIVKSLDDVQDPWLEALVLRRAKNAFGGASSTLRDNLIAHLGKLAGHHLEFHTSEKGIKAVYSALQELPDDPRILNFYAVLLAASGHEKSSVENFQKALRNTRDPGLLSEIQANLGFAYSNSGNLAEARRHLKNALKFNPRNQTAAQRLANLEANR